MKRFIKNLENQGIVIAILIVGVMVLIFPDHLAKAFPYLLGAGLLMKGIAIVILALRYKDPSDGPGKVITFGVLGLVIMILGSEAIGIIGVIWAVFTLEEVSEDINDMWKGRKYSPIHILTGAVSIVLAVMLMIEPFKHFTTHVAVLGLEIIFSCLAKGVDIIKAGLKRRDRSELSAGSEDN